MKQLCYVSFLSDDVDVKDVVDSIHKISEIKNPKYGLTGRLIYSNEIFIQLIEGEEVNVDILYSIIGNDKRHFGLQALFEQETEERAYPEWSMKFDFTENINLVSINKVLNTANKISGKGKLSKTDIIEIFDQFAK